MAQYYWAIPPIPAHSPAAGRPYADMGGSQEWALSGWRSCIGRHWPGATPDHCGAVGESVANQGSALELAAQSYKTAA